MSGNGSYADTTATFDITVNKVPQTITFTPDSSYTYGQAAGAKLGLSVTSGLAFDAIYSTTPDICTTGVYGGPGVGINIIGAGTCTIVASQGGTSFYAPVTTAYSFTIAQATQSLTFQKLKDTNFSIPSPQPVPLIAYSTSQLPATFTASGACSFVTSSGQPAVSFDAVGQCSVTASQAGDANYAAAAPVTRSFTINKGINKITFPAPANAVWNLTPPALAATSAKGGAVSYNSTTTAVCDLAHGLLTLVGPGQCSITATQLGDANYADAVPVTLTFPVANGFNLITFPAPSDTPVNAQSPPALTATSNSKLTVGYAVTTPAVCSLSGSTLTLLTTGDCSITATQAGNGTTIAAATPVTQTFKVTAAINAITFNTLPSIALNGAPAALSASALDGTIVFTPNNNNCSVSGTTITLLKVGPCSITASVGATTNFGPAKPVTQTFQITTIPNVITFPSPGNSAVGVVLPQLSATGLATTPVTYTSNPQTVCTVTADGTVKLVAPGACTITAAQATDGRYAAAAPVKQAFTVGLGANVIAFTAPTGVTTDSALQFAATASSGLTVSYASNSASICKVSASGALTIVTVGQCSITASQAGSPSYVAAVPSTQAFAIAAGTNTLKFAQVLPDVAITSPPPVLTATSSVSAVSYTSSTPLICSVTLPGVLTFNAVGACMIVASDTSSASVTRTFAVKAAVGNTISLTAPQNTLLSGGPVTLGATASSNLPVAYTPNTPTVCSVSTSGVVALKAVGSCSITLSQNGNANFAAATPVPVTFSVTSTANTITFPALADTVFTATPPLLKATANSKLAVSYLSTTPNVCTVTANGTIKFASGGPCSITATQGGNATFAAATPLARTFTVLPAANTISFAQPANTVLTAASPVLAATAKSGLPVTYTSNSLAICTVAADGKVTLLTAGTCSITASDLGNAAYAAATLVTRTFTLTQGANTITFPALANTPFASTPPTLAATASLPVTYTSNSATCTVDAGVIAFVSGGTCSVTASQGGSTAVAAALPVTRTFTITPSANTITFQQPVATPFTATPPVPEATATSGQPVSFASNSSGICTVKNGVITFVAGGICSITASQAATVSWSAAAPVTLTFAITNGNNNLTFAQPADTPFTSAAPALTASASSGLRVTYASNDEAICKVTTGGAIAFVAGGSCSITASQAGNGSYTVAPSVTNIFSVLPGTNTITFAQPADLILSATPPSPGANASSGLVISYGSTTPGICKATLGGAITLIAPGTCTITASQGGNASYAAATPASQSFTVNANPTTTGGARAAASARLMLAAPPTTGSSTTISASTLSPLLGQAMTLTASVSPTPTGGTVSFSDGLTVLCDSVALNGATATCQASFTTGGDHSLTADYSGDANFKSSTSSALTVTVNDQRLTTLQTIAQFLGLRSDLLASSAPDGARQIDRLAEADAAAHTGQQVAGGDAADGWHLTTAVALASSRGADNPLAAFLNSNPYTQGPSRGGVSLGAPANDSSANVVSPLAALLHLQGNTEGAPQFSFSTSLRDVTRFAAADDARKAADAGVAFTDRSGVAFAARPNPFDIWAEGKYTSFRDAGFASNQDGHFAMLTVGADYVVSPNLLVGAMVEFDSVNQLKTLAATQSSGQGWMAGPYATFRLIDGVYLQTRAAWGKSSNQVSPFLSSTDSYETQRWLLAATLSGRWSNGPWSVRPTAAISVLEDDAQSYTDTFGAIVPEVKTRLGQAKIGPDIGYTYQLGNGVLLEPHASAQVIWNFASSATSPGYDLSTSDALGARGRVEFGLRAAAANGVTLDASGSYDGIGSQGVQAVTGAAKISVPLN